MLEHSTSQPESVVCGLLVSTVRGIDLAKMFRLVLISSLPPRSPQATSRTDGLQRNCGEAGLTTNSGSDATITGIIGSAKASGVQDLAAWARGCQGIQGLRRNGWHPAEALADRSPPGPCPLEILTRTITGGTNSGGVGSGIR